MSSPGKCGWDICCPKGTDCFTQEEHPGQLALRVKVGSESERVAAFADEGREEPRQYGVPKAASSMIHVERLQPHLWDRVRLGQIMSYASS
jgi:hypothetical protein